LLSHLGGSATGNPAASCDLKISSGAFEPGFVWNGDEIAVPVVFRIVREDCPSRNMMAITIKLTQINIEIIWPNSTLF
jgi:hypothetical protein